MRQIMIRNIDLCRKMGFLSNLVDLRQTMWKYAVDRYSTQPHTFTRAHTNIHFYVSIYVISKTRLSPTEMSH